MNVGMMIRVMTPKRHGECRSSNIEADDETEEGVVDDEQLLELDYRRRAKSETYKRCAYQ